MFIIVLNLTAFWRHGLWIVYVYINFVESDKLHYESNIIALHREVLPAGGQRTGATTWWTTNTNDNIATSSSLVSFTQFFPLAGRARTRAGRMPLPALSLWPGRQLCRPRLVDGRRGGGPSSVAPRSRNPPTGRRRDRSEVRVRF